MKKILNPTDMEGMGSDHVTDQELESYFVDVPEQYAPFDTLTRTATERHLLECRDCLERFLQKMAEISTQSGQNAA